VRRFVALSVLLLVSVGWAAAPAQLAETVRSELMAARVQLMISPESARAPLERAERAYTALGLAGLEPAAHPLIQNALNRTARAARVPAGDPLFPPGRRRDARAEALASG